MDMLVLITMGMEMEEDWRKRWRQLDPKRTETFGPDLEMMRHRPESCILHECHRANQQLLVSDLSTML